MFTKDFDESLWCILEGDIAERAAIIELLNRVPAKLYSKIREALEAHSDVSQYTEEPIYIKNSITTDSGICYSYEISLEEQEKSIELKESLGNTDSNKDAISFTTSLSLVKECPPYDIKLDGETWLGALTHIIEIQNTFISFGTAKAKGFTPTIITDEKDLSMGNYQTQKELEYHLVFGDTDHLIRLENGRRKVELAPIDTSLIPAELSLDYLNKRYSYSEGKEK